MYEAGFDIGFTSNRIFHHTYTFKARFDIGVSFKAHDTWINRSIHRPKIIRLLNWINFRELLFYYLELSIIVLLRS